MPTDTVEQRVFAVIQEILRIPPERILRESRFKEDLGADSLDLVSLMMALEEEFKGAISEEQEALIPTVGAAIDFIRDQMVKKVPA